MNIGNVTAPHEVRDSKKFAALCAAYEAGESVPPVVVLDFGHVAKAICGSHRIAAAQETLWTGTDVEVLDWIVVDGDAVYEAADASVQAELDSMLRDGGVDYDELCEALLPVLPEAARAVLVRE